ncbi:MAG: serine/threonine protein kinase [Candidatus Margulisbacteria bacterium]|jgi:serine/threonine protein kinase|nr:serine/threonine protein kinase [Candidatus Margulisiibacteriota bacterium]
MSAELTFNRITFRSRGQLRPGQLSAPKLINTTGGSAKVYESQIQIGKRTEKIALKFVPDKALADLARDERDVLHWLWRERGGHPNIVKFYGEINRKESTEVCGLAVELLAEDLAGYLKNKGSLPLDEVLTIGEQVAKGLAFSSEHGVKAHKDLKTENIMHRPETNEWVVVDFALAKKVRDENIIYGTPACMSPEQHRNEELDQRSDIFSFGLILHELLTGQHPVLREGEKIDDFLLWVTSLYKRKIEPKQEFPVLPKVSRSQYIQERLAAIVEKMCAPAKEDRYQDWPEVITDLKKLKQESSSFNEISGLIDEALFEAQPEAVEIEID